MVQHKGSAFDVPTAPVLQVYTTSESILGVPLQIHVALIGNALTGGAGTGVCRQ